MRSQYDMTNSDRINELFCKLCVVSITNGVSCNEMWIMVFLVQLFNYGILVGQLSSLQVKE